MDNDPIASYNGIEKINVIEWFFEQKLLFFRAFIFFLLQKLHKFLKCFIVVQNDYSTSKD